MVDVAGWALSSMGGWWSFVMGDCRLWVGIVICGWGIVVCGGGWLFVVEGGHLWWGTIVCGWGWSFVVRCCCSWMRGGRSWSSGCVRPSSMWGVAIRRGSLSSVCGTWSSMGVVVVIHV